MNSDVRVDEMERVNGAEESTETRTRRRPWANPRFRIALLGIIIVAAIAAYFLYRYYSGTVSTDDAQVNADIVPIAPKVYGKVAEVLVNDNQEVKAGQVLVRLDPSDYQAKVEQEKAALALAESRAQAAKLGVPLTAATTSSGTENARAQVTAAEAELVRAKQAYQQAATAEVSYARANIASAQANYEKAQADLERMKPLVEKAEISRQQYDAFLAAARVAEAQLQAAKDRLASAQHEVEMRQAAVNTAQAQVNQARAALVAALANTQQVPITSAQATSASAAVLQARANLQAAELQVSYTTITAPTDGQITRKSVEPGQIVQPGQSLMVLVPLQRVYVTANFKETQLANVRPGQKAEVKVDTYAKTFPGYVGSISGATGSRLSLLPPENATGNFVKVVQRIPVRIELYPIKDPNYVLRPGMNVVATIATK